MISASSSLRYRYPCAPPSGRSSSTPWPTTRSAQRPALALSREAPRQETLERQQPAVEAPHDHVPRARHVAAQRNDGMPLR